MFWADFEVSLLRLLEKVTNGTVIEISYTGQSNPDSEFSIEEINGTFLL